MSRRGSSSQRATPAPSPSPRGGRGGRGRRGRGASPPQQQQRPSPSAAASASSSSSLSRDFERRVSLEERSTPAPSTARVPAPAPAQQLPLPSSTKAIRFPARPGFGTLGSKCVVRANHFLVEIAEDKDLCHYDKMVNGGNVEYWTCINFSRLPPDAVHTFCHELVGMCRNIGMAFSPNPLVPIRADRPNRIEMALMDVHKLATAKLQSGDTKKHLQLLIIILPDMSGSYGKIKRVCETELGIVSQCCQPRQASKVNKQYLENVALKINVKVGGRNTVLADAVASRIPYVTDVPTIIFGADVMHPPPGEDSSPSIAAVVASMDWPEVTKYRGLVSAQPLRQELIRDLFQVVRDPQRGSMNKGMILEQLIAFRQATGRKPHRIIFYRAGVSEGQFSQVLLYELDAIRKACVSLEEGYVPPVTFVVVQKRHRTRLFPADHRDGNSTDRSGNILPGTVVDTKICHPIEFGFYLCSHAGIQGTSHPAHYHVLWDENKFTADALQKLTNDLCYTYARCTRSVSIVPPVYYAHLVAFRARYYMEHDVSDGGSTSAAGGNTREWST